MYTYTIEALMEQF